jgi:hypothetical protein
MQNGERRYLEDTAQWQRKVVAPILTELCSVLDGELPNCRR